MTSPDTEFISILGASGSPEAPSRVSARSLPDRLPILGLSDIVIFPGMVAPLLVETPQSTKLIDEVVAGDRLLGVVLQRNAEAENPLPHEMHEVGCAARVLKMLKFPDNTVRVLVEGLWRIRMKEYVATSISKTQCDFFLREQMRAIQRELGESDPNASEVRTLREKIEQTAMPAEARQVATQELDRLQQMPPAAAEYGVTRHYIDWILALPWAKETEDKIDLAEAEKILNEQHFGLTKVKDR